VRSARRDGPSGLRCPAQDHVYLRLKDEFGSLYEDAAFAPLFSSRGRPAEAPWRLALVSILQFLEGLPDRPAAEAVRSRIDWKYLLGLDLTDAGFHFSVLSEFRSRLIAGEAAERLFDHLLTRLKAHGWLRARGRQRTDATHVLAAIRSLNRLELVGRTLQHALNTLAVAAPEWLQAQIGPEWFERYSKPLEDSRFPKEEAGRLALAEQIGHDGQHLLLRLGAQQEMPWLEHVPAVVTLRQVWDQQYRQVDGQLRWRNKDDLPPSAARIASPHDRDARYSTKRSVTWVGYKVHLTETCDDDQPHVITHVETAPATEGDPVAVAQVHHALAQRALLPKEHLVDAAYGSGETLVASQTDYGVELVCPVPPDTSWQAQDAQAFPLTCFTIEWEAQRVICPQGKVSHLWLPEHGPRGKPTIQVQFRRADCRACPVRSRCTRKKTDPRDITLHPQAIHLALVAARGRQQTLDFKRRYAKRAGVEGTISQSASALDLRRSRYIGLARTHLQHLLTASAINLLRVVAWLEQVPPSQTRRSHFAALAAA
jgi:transposase